MSTPGALLQFSLVLRPRLGLEQAGLLTTALGVACAEGIERASGLPATIKWPNDVRIGGKKVAGMLVESHVVGSSLEAAVAGIGINVGWARDEIPEEIRDHATSIAAELGDAGPDRAELLAGILSALEPRYRSLPNSGPDLITEATRRSDVIGSKVKVRFSDGREVEGLAEGLIASGALTVVTPGGTTIVSAAEVEQLRPHQAPR
jgi:BirA family biotin operon repressor/biotin-[acetyl-CoA-carboxylase] ligase